MNINFPPVIRPTLVQSQDRRRTNSCGEDVCDATIRRARSRSLSAPASLAVALMLAPRTGTAQAVDSPKSLCAPQSDEDHAAKRRIQKALYPEQIATIQPLAPGQSGAHVFRATSAQGQQYFAKIVQRWADIPEPAEMRKEFAEAAWGASRGFAPPVVFSEPEQGTLITEFIKNEMADWDQGGQEPRLSATLSTMRRLHLCDVSSERAIYDSEGAFLSWEKERSKVSPNEQQNPYVQMASKIAFACIGALAKETYDVVTRHGDLHQSNVIYNSGRAWLIDWGSRNDGDAMQEVAYFAYHVDFPMRQFDSLLETYAPLSPEDSKRAKYHLALMHAHRYLQTLRGMPWDLPEWRESKLRMHEAYLIEDLDWLTKR